MALFSSILWFVFALTRFRSRIIRACTRARNPLEKQRSGIITAPPTLFRYERALKTATTATTNNKQLEGHLLFQALTWTAWKWYRNKRYFKRISIFLGNLRNAGIEYCGSISNQKRFETVVWNAAVRCELCLLIMFTFVVLVLRIWNHRSWRENVHSNQAFYQGIQHRSARLIQKAVPYRIHHWGLWKWTWILSLPFNGHTAANGQCTKKVTL